MIPESVLTQALEAEMGLLLDDYSYDRPLARKLLAHCHEIMKSQPQPEAAKLVAAVQVIENWLRHKPYNEVQLRPTYVKLYPGHEVFLTEAGTRPLSKAIIDAAEGILKQG